LGYGEVDRTTISRWIEGVQKSKFGEMHTPSSIQYYTIWNIPKLATDQLKYPGQLPESLLENVLYYWTEPGQIVYDPFAGSGTTGRVADRMMRRYQMSDIAPWGGDARMYQLHKLFR